MKQGFLNSIAAAGMVVFTFAACNNPQDKDAYDNNSDGVVNTTTDKDQADLAEDHNDAKFDQAQEKDAQFAVDAAVIHLREIEASNIAVTRSANADVKALAQTMVADHRKAMDELSSLTGKKNITIPSSLSEDEAKKANKLRDEKDNFDKKYNDMLVDEHKKAIDKFEKASTDCQDADLRAWAGKMLPSLRHHLDMAMALRDRMKS